MVKKEEERKLEYLHIGVILLFHDLFNDPHNISFLQSDILQLTLVTQENGYIASSTLGDKW